MVKVRMAVLLIVLSLFHSLCCTSAGSNDFHNIVHILGPACTKFHQLGIALNLDVSVMDVILDEARRSKPYNSLCEVLKQWLTWNYPHERFGKPSLSLLVEAVYSYNCPLAVKLFDTFTATCTDEPWFTC